MLKSSEFKWQKIIPIMRLALCLLFTLSPDGSMAKDLIREQAWTADPQGDWSSEIPPQAEFTSYNGLLNRGFKQDRIWIRLDIDPFADKQSKHEIDPNELVVLRIRPALLEHVQLFDPLSASSKPRTTGLAYRWSDDEHQTLNLNFMIPRGDKPRTLWLRIDSTISRIVHVEVLDQQVARQKDNLQSMWYGVYLGLIVLFLGAALFHWFEFRERLLLAFAVKQCFAIIFSLSLMGYMRVFGDGTLLQHALTYFHVLSVLTLVAASLYYEYLFLLEIGPTSIVKWALKAAMWSVPVVFLVWLIGEIQWVLVIQMYFLLVLPFVGLFAVAFSRYPSRSQTSKPVLSKKILVPAYLLILYSVLMAVVPVLGYWRPSELALHSPLFHGVITGSLMVILLQIRAAQISKARSIELTELATAREKARNEQLQREEREKMLSMLAHELKTPLASIRMLVALREISFGAIEEIRGAVRDINDIVDRCSQAGRLQDLKEMVHLEEINLTEEVYLMRRRLSSEEFVNIDLPAMLMVKADVQVLRMLLGNLMSNAVKYRLTDSIVWIRLAPKLEDKGRVCLQIDNLEGASGRPDAKKVFSKYYRNPKARRKSGSGLGLYLVSELVEQMEATVRYVEDEKLVRFELCILR